MKALLNIDRRIIYIILFIALAIPLINPLGIPVAVGLTTNAFYKLVEDLPNGSLVLMSMDVSPSGAPDVFPNAVAAANHMIKKGHKAIILGFWEQGVPFSTQIMQQFVDAGYVYGTDVLNLGYVAGAESAIQSMAQDIAGTFPVDYLGRRTADFPMMQGVKDINDIDIILEFATGDPGFNAYLRQVIEPYPGVQYAVAVVTVSFPGLMPYFASGQVKGALQGLRGAAEYEILNGIPGQGAARMDAQSLGHIVIIAFIILGNLAYFVSKSTEKKK
ncbi:MAG TPA: hypothetical protein VK905_05260 [Bacillota bacterium]|nr:hypothetical protein [Bacillota bacterium]